MAEMSYENIDARIAIFLQILAERNRQIDQEGFDAANDDERDCGELADAAACYALGKPEQIIKQLWPWSAVWWKATTRKRNLIKAGALIVAELERLERVEKKDLDEKRQEHDQ